MYMNGNSKTIMKRILIIMMALVCTGAVLCIIISISTPFPKWIKWQSGTSYDQSGQYETSLKHKSVSIMYDNAVVWTSPDGVKVQQVLSCDIDNDYEDELILLCWKKGRFGRYKPFWIEEKDAEDEEWSQHIFVYEYGYEYEQDIAGAPDAGKSPAEDIIQTAAPGEIRPKWMSSYIGQDVTEIASNGKEAPYCRLLLTAPDGQVSSWVWDSWGFTKENGN